MSNTRSAHPWKSPSQAHLAQDEWLRNHEDHAGTQDANARHQSFGLLSIAAFLQEARRRSRPPDVAEGKELVPELFQKPTSHPATPLELSLTIPRELTSRVISLGLPIVHLLRQQGSEGV